MFLSRRVACSVLLPLMAATAAFSSQPVLLLEETFSRSVAGTMDQVYYAGDIDDITDNPGWITDSFGQSEGMFVFSPTISSVRLITPVLHAGAGAVVEVEMDMAEYNNERYFTGGILNVALLAGDNTLIDAHDICVDEACFADYSTIFVTPSAASDLRVAFSFDNGGNRHKLFLDGVRVTTDIPDGSVGEVEADESDAWVSGRHEITLKGTHAQVYAPDGRCLYRGGAATLRLTSPYVIIIVDGKVKKLQIN